MKNIKYIIGVVLVAVLITVIYFLVRPSENEANEELDQTESHEEHGHGPNRKVVELNKAQFKNSEIEFGQFEMKNISEVINANGYTKLPPQNQADVTVFTSGIIKQINVIEGQAVKKGQVLATIESPEFSILQQDYLIAKSNLEYLRLDYERQLKLNEADANSNKTLQKTKSEMNIEEARFNALKQQLNILGINGEGNPVSSILVRAPLSGHITDVFVNIGTSVQQGKTLFSIVDNSEMHVDLLVYEKDLYKLKEGQTVRFVLTNQSNKEISGKIFNIGKSFENETKTVAVHADIEDKGTNLIPGMYVNALIDVGADKVKTLPESAIVNAEGRSFIFVFQEHSHGGEGHGNHMEFMRVEVQTGATQLGSVEIIPVQKIPKGGKIVTHGAFYLQSHLQKSEGAGGHSH